MLAYILDRAREPSSYAGLAALLGIIGVQFAPEQMTVIINAATGVAALLAMLLKDRA